MKVLVTGGSGFIGQHLVKRLRLMDTVTKVVSVSRKGCYYAGDLDLRQFPGGSFHIPFEEINCNLEYDRTVASLMLRLNPDVIFHLAGNPIIKGNDNDPTAIGRTNILATHNLLAYAKPGCRFVFASSAAVYGDEAGKGFFANETWKTKPTSIYGATKLASEALVQAYTSLGKVNGLSLRLVANVGYGATHGVLKDVVAKLKSDSPTLELLGNSPGSEKHYVYVQDTVSAFILLGLSPTVGGVVNVANDDTINIRLLADVAMFAMEMYKPITWLGENANWKGDNRKVQVCNRSAHFYGWKPIYTSEQAIFAAVKEMEQL